MQAVTIYDSLSILANSTGQLKLNCEWSGGFQARTTAIQKTETIARRDLTCSPSEPVFGDLPRGDDNIVLRAVERLRVRAGIEMGAEIRLVKRIPAAAGLGGASSDAAAALVAANNAWRLGWSLSRLAEVAAELGSDIPFFFGSGQFGTGTAVCRGRGERIESVTGLPILHFVVVRPPVGLSTPQVFRNCRPADRPVELQPFLAAARRGDLSAMGRRLHNRLQPAAVALSPWIERMQREFQRFEFVAHQMSGSGSSYFGICRHARQARRLASALRNAEVGAVFCASTAPAARYDEGRAIR